MKFQQLVGLTDFDICNGSCFRSRCGSDP